MSGPGGNDTNTKDGYIFVTSGTFTKYGVGTAGSNGVTDLSGAGDLAPGSGPGFGLTLTHAAVSSPAMIFVGLSSGNFPIKGQSLLVFQLLGSVSLGMADNGGTIATPASIPAAAPPMSMYLQAWVLDKAGPQGLTSSNGLHLTIP